MIIENQNVETEVGVRVLAVAVIVAVAIVIEVVIVKGVPDNDTCDLDLVRQKIISHRQLHHRPREEIIDRDQHHRLRDTNEDDKNDEINNYKYLYLPKLLIQNFCSFFNVIHTTNK